MIENFLSLSGLARRLDRDERKIRALVRSGKLVPDGLMQNRFYIFRTNDDRLKAMVKIIKEIESPQIIA